MGNTSMLACSRIWLLKIVETGESYFYFDGIKKKALFAKGHNIMRNGIADISLIISVDDDCLLILNGRALQGLVMKTCTSNPRDGPQYILRVNGRAYRFSILEDYKTAIFEEMGIIKL